MANYTKATNFATKDSLATGNPNKIVKGTELNSEFDAIAVAVATKQDILPTGIIVMWSGATNAVPTGWALCNGQNGTPNLVDRFIIGAGGNYGVGSTGGTADAIIPSHTHTATSTVTDPGHLHSATFDTEVGNGNLYDGGPFGRTGSRNTTTSTTGITVATTISTVGESATGKNLPPYLALAYIMKL